GASGGATAGRGTAAPRQPARGDRPGPGEPRVGEGRCRERAPAVRAPQIPPRSCCGGSGEPAGCGQRQGRLGCGRGETGRHPESPGPGRGWPTPGGGGRGGGAARGYPENPGPDRCWSTPRGGGGGGGPITGCRGAARAPAAATG